MLELEEITETALSMVYPRHCPVCDGVLKTVEIKNGRLMTGRLVHDDCNRKVKRIGRCTCVKCGKGLARGMEDEEYCSDCRKAKHYFDRGFSVFEYRSISGSIYRFKYMGRQEYASFYAKEIEKLYGNNLKKLGIEALIPVPMYRNKENQRGYNQAEVLARSVSKRLNIPVYENIVERTRNTLPMKQLDLRGRRNNLKKAFNIAKNDVKFKCILIIDDIYTTGSTIDEIAHEFRIAGVKKIYCLSLAIGQTT